MNGKDTISLDIPLPPALRGLTNEIVVTLVDNTPNQGICRAGPEAAAQLLPESRLDASPTPADDRQALVKALASAASVTIPPDSGAGLPAAEFLTGMLDLILPLDTDTKFAAADDTTTIEVVNAERLQSLVSADSSEGARNAFLVVPSSRAGSDGVAVLRLAETASLPPPIDIGSNALLVTW